MRVTPNELDLRIRDVVRDALGAHAGSFELEFTWSDRASTWFTEVQPTRQDSAPISVGHDGRGDLFVTVANAHFELWGVDHVSELEHLSRIVAAVAAGRVQESGSEKAATIRIELTGGDVFRAGPVRIPRPWAERHARRFASYT